MSRLFVLVTFWNCERLLERCLASVAIQTQPVTVVLVDDASEPPAAELARRWSEREEQRVLLTLPENLGPAAARHAGLNWIRQHSKDPEDIVVLLDGDDEFAHERVLSTITDVYTHEPRTQMTLGGMRRASGRPVYAGRYVRSHLLRHQVRATPWRARHPRSFRLALLEKAWPKLRLVWPSGGWLRSATDQALLLPLLDELAWEELCQLEDVLYVYNDVRPDGATMEASMAGRARQLLAEAYVRRSVRWTAAALPSLALSTAKRRWRRLRGEG